MPSRTWLITGVSSGFGRAPASSPTGRIGALARVGLVCMKIAPVVPFCMSSLQ